MVNERQSDRESAEPFLGPAGRLVYERAKGRKRPWSFANRGGRTPQQWRVGAHQVLLEGMGCQFDPVDLDVRREGEVQRDGYLEQRVSFTATPLHRLAATVLVP